MTYRVLKCPGQDSNLHVLSNTTTSKWLVYQFQHLGNLKNFKQELLYPRRELNPYSPFGKLDFKSNASTSSATGVTIVEKKSR